MPRRRDSETLLIAGYGRTSGEGQRDNTSLPNQQQTILECCKRNGWKMVRFYSDECKSGGKVAGRDEFQQMVKDAMDGQYDLIVPFDIGRFARDGVDILSYAKLLKADYGVLTVDAKGQFDNRTHRNTLANYVHAGAAEDERLRIMERTMSGRIRRAMEGLPWSARTARPIGRDYDPKTKQWYITERGKAIVDILRRYLDGGKSTALAKELTADAGSISSWVRNCQISGIYHATFLCPALGLDTDIPVPAIPELVSPEMLEQLKARLCFNRTNNRTDVQTYFLAGFLRCVKCGKSLTGRTQRGKKWYYHSESDSTLKTVPGNALEAAVLDFLYGAFLDQPAFDAAVKQAMPTGQDRKALLSELKEAENRLSENRKKTDRLVDAIANGADVSLLIEKQASLKAERSTLQQRVESLSAVVASLPDAEQTTRAAMLTRLRLVMEHQGGKDWRELPYEDVRRFLHHLFGNSTHKSRTGIFAEKDDQGRILITFKGQVEFRHFIAGHRPVSEALQKQADRYNAEIQRGYERRSKPLGAYQSVHHCQTFPCMS